MGAIHKRNQEDVEGSSREEIASVPKHSDREPEVEGCSSVRVNSINSSTLQQESIDATEPHQTVLLHQPSMNSIQQSIREEMASMRKLFDREPEVEGCSSVQLDSIDNFTLQKEDINATELYQMAPLHQPSMESTKQSIGEEFTSVPTHSDRDSQMTRQNSLRSGSDDGLNQQEEQSEVSIPFHQSNMQDTQRYNREHSTYEARHPDLNIGMVHSNSLHLDSTNTTTWKWRKLPLYFYNSMLPLGQGSVGYIHQDIQGTVAIPSPVAVTTRQELENARRLLQSSPAVEIPTTRLSQFYQVEVAEHPSWDQAYQKSILKRTSIVIHEYDSTIQECDTAIPERARF